MEPRRELQATISDLLERVLDKGLIVNADIIITLSGVPLIGISLSAAIAGMETMLEYGLMSGWDVNTRVRDRELAKERLALRT